MTDERRRPAWVKAAVGAFLAAELAAAALLLGRPGTPNATKQDAPRPSATARPRAEAPSQSDEERRHDAVERVLQARADAIRTRDRHRFGRTLDQAHPAFVRSQLAMFDALAEVPIAGWRYDLHGDGDVVPAPPPGAEEAWAPSVSLRYQLRGYDDEPPAVPQFFTFVRRGDRWLTASDSDFDTDPRRRTGRELWDFGRVAVARGQRSLVLGHPADRPLLNDVARLADAAVPRVTRVWGSDWARRVVVLVPSTQKEASAILGEGLDLSRIAAVAVAELPGDTGDRAVGNRIIVNPATFARLAANGRRVVLTHETTHVATRDASVPGMPTWLVEGFADYVGYLGTGLSPRQICRELADDVRNGKAPKTLPDDKSFDGANEDLAQAYEASWIAIRMIVERTGEDRLVEFYREAGRTSVDEAMRTVLDTTPETFTAAWRSYMRATLG